MVLGFGIANIAYAQNVSISGRVSDEATGEPIPGVTVVVKGTTNGTITDFDGYYDLTVEKGSTVQYSYIGYIKQEQIVDVSTTSNILLQVDTEQLEEVVVIGYGQVKKGDATGSLTAVSSDDFNKGAITSPQELISGKSAGVVITTSDGSPGGNSQIRIRGGSSLRANNDPLIVIDGFPVDNSSIGGLSNTLSTINPNDIESMTVLKDASATAIYGSRASNGVIIITTKKGQAGRPFKVTYSGNTSVSHAANMLDVLNGDEFRTVLEDRVTNYDLTEFALTRLGEANTNWQDQVYRTSVSTDHNLSMTGNYKNIPYRASLGYTDQNGILKYSSMNRTTLDLSASPSLLEDHLKVNVNVKGIDINNNFSNTDAIGSSAVFDPTQPITNGNTVYGGYFAWTELSDDDPINGIPNNIATQNPVAQLKYRDNKSDVQRFFGNLQLDYMFHALPELRANLNMGYDYSKSVGDDNIDPRASWSYREPSQNVTSYTNIVETKLLDFYLNYTKELDEISSKIDVTTGYSWQHFYREGDNANRPWELTDGEYVGADTTVYKNENYLVSFFGRVNYSLLDRYLVTVTLREDGSSRFSKDNRWGLFPSAAFAWKINEEMFMESVPEINELKLRVGWGITGQQDISDNYYPYLATYRISQMGAYYQFGDTYYPTQRPNAYDANIKWEETTTSNIGIDFGLFDDKVIGSLDYYQRTTKDLINEIPIAVGTNFSNYLTTNVGTLENKGFEAALTVRTISTPDVRLEISGTFSYNQNEITKLTRVNDPSYTGYLTGDDISGGVGNKVLINSVGHPANSFYLFKQVYDDGGMPIEGLYIDKTGNGGTVSGDDANKYYLGKAAPDYLIGLSSRLTYKQFDFSFNGRLSLGNYVYNNNASNKALYQNLYNQSGFTSNIPTSISDTEFSNAQFFSDVYLEDASFFRMDNINIGYSFNEFLTEKLSGRVGFTLQNAFVITKYSGLDPEVSTGIDNNIYPRPRTCMLGLTLDF